MSLTGSTTTWYGADALGSVRYSTNSSGSSIGSATYDVFGAQRQTSGQQNTYRFGGQEQHSDLGLIHMRARWYDTATGRFVSRDPATPSWSQPRTLNPYGYAYANPAIVTDPTGLWGGVDDLVALAGGAIIGGGISIVTQQIAHPGTIDWGKVGVGAVSGAVSAEVSLYAGPLAGGAAGGFVGDFGNQLYVNRGFNNFNVGELTFATVASGASGWTLGQFGLGGPTARGLQAFKTNSAVGKSSALFGSVGKKPLINNNDILRVGWGYAPGGRDLFRIAIGNKDAPFWFHIDFWGAPR